MIFELITLDLQYQREFWSMIFFMIFLFLFPAATTYICMYKYNFLRVREKAHRPFTIYINSSYFPFILFYSPSPYPASDVEILGDFLPSFSPLAFLCCMLYIHTFNFRMLQFSHQKNYHKCALRILVNEILWNKNMYIHIICLYIHMEIYK